MEAQNLKEDAKDILNHAGDYAETFYKLNLLRLTKKVSDVASVVVNSVLIFFISLCILLFISFAGAWWLGDIVQNRAWIFNNSRILLADHTCSRSYEKKSHFPFYKKHFDKKNL